MEWACDRRGSEFGVGQGVFGEAELGAQNRESPPYADKRAPASVICCLSRTKRVCSNMDTTNYYLPPAGSITACSMLLGHDRVRSQSHPDTHPGLEGTFRARPSR